MMALKKKPQLEDAEPQRAANDPSQCPNRQSEADIEENKANESKVSKSDSIKSEPKRKLFGFFVSPQTSAMSLRRKTYRQYV